MPRGLVVAKHRRAKKFRKDLSDFEQLFARPHDNLSSNGPCVEETKLGNNPGVVAHVGRRTADQAKQEIEQWQRSTIS
jgi:hypothetical protein